jgi:uncharacterized protein (DUF2126 family)
MNTQNIINQHKEWFTALLFQVALCLMLCSITGILNAQTNTYGGNGYNKRYIPVGTCSITSVASNCDITLTATGVAPYFWSNGETTQSITVSPTAATTYSVISGYGCNSCKASVNVNPANTPILSTFITLANLACGQNTSLSASGANTYTWQPGSLSGSNITTTPLVTTTYTVTGTNSLGCTNTATRLVTVSPINVTISGSTTPLNCGQNKSLSASGANTYSWQPGLLSGSNINVTPLVTTTYTVTGTSSSGCTNTATHVVTVNPINVTISGSSTPITCGQNKNLSANGATNYIWQPGSLTGSNITVTPLVTTTYTVIGTSSSGCTNTATRLVTVNPINVTISGSTTPLNCGQNKSLSASGANTYSWQPGLLTGSNINVTPLVTTTYTVTGTSSSGCTNTSTHLVTVNPINVTISGSPTPLTCGQSKSLSASGANTYSWQPGLLTGSNITVTPLVTTTYTVTGTSSSGCTNTATHIVTVNPINVTISGSTTPLNCGQNKSLSASGANTYSWQPGLLTGSNINVTPLVTTTYTVTGTSSSGCTNTSTHLVTVNPINVTISGSPTPLTCGQSKSLSASGANTYSWQPGLLTGSNITVTPLVTTTYTVTGTSSSGCTNTATHVVTFNPINVTISGSSATLTCGQSQNLSANGATSYIWQPGSLTGSNITVTPLVTTTYTVTGTNSNGCTDTASRVVEVTPFSVSISGSINNINCGASINLSASGANSYVWQPGSLTGSNITVTPLVTTTYTVTGSSLFGCTYTATRTVTVNPTINVSAVSTATNICLGNSTTITASGAATYVWQPGNQSGNSITVSPSGTSTFTVTGTNVNGCSGSATVLITVNSVPTVGTTATATTICSGSSTTITGTGASTYTWQPGNLSGNFIMVSPTTTTTYTVTGANTNGCTQTAVRLIIVNPGPVANAGVDKTLTCTTSSAIIGTAAIAGNTYSWSPATALNANNIAMPISTALVTTTYTVTVTGANGCTGSDVVVVNVNTTLPPVGTTVSNSTICTGNSTTLTASGASTYMWQPGGMITTSITVSPAVTTIYTVTGTAANGCTNTTTTTINVGASCGTVLNLTLFIQGYYIGGGTMNATLSNQGLPNSLSDCDDITVELHDVMVPYAMAYSYTGILHTNGTITCSFPSAVLGNSYYISVKNRGAVEIWSANPITLTPVTNYDFTTSNVQSYGGNQVEVEPSIWALYSGDINQDGVCDAFDFIILDQDVASGNFGYLTTDLTGDGVVDAFDYILLDPNIINGITIINP